MLRYALIGCFVLCAMILAACGGGETGSAPEADSTESAAVVVEEAEEIPPTFEAPEFLGQVMVAGVRPVAGLSVGSSRTYISPNGTGWVVLDVTNQGEEPISNVAVLLSLLDDESRERETLRFSTPFLNIPAGLSIPMALSFPAPPNYTDFVALVQVESYDDSNPFNELQGVYELPYTLNESATQDFPLRLSGRLSNNSGQILIAPVAVVSAYDAAGNILGAALPVLSGLSEDGEWLDGVDLNFETSFSYLPEMPAEIRVMSAGYFSE